MVRGGRYVEAANKRVSDIEWSWAVATINKLVNQCQEAAEKDPALDPVERKRRSTDIEKAWQRILQG